MTHSLGRSRFSKRAMLAVLLLGAVGLAAMAPKSVHAAPGDDCTGDYFVDETFASGARWQMCWEHRELEGIVFSDIYYTPPGGSARMVLYEAHIAQIHVPYDDNGARFHDVTDYSIGGDNMDDLDSADCPGGTLLRDGGKDVVCKQISDLDVAYRHGGRFSRGEVLKLFSVTHVGAYNYIPEWRFHADGTLAPTIGATGRLQRFGSNSSFGWPISNGSTTGISHIHNYHWRLDFQFQESDPAEVVEEVDHIRVGTTREKQVTAFTTEANRSVDRDLRRSWRIRDAVATNAAGAAISYHIEPSHHAHDHVGPSYEPWTQDDFYVTKYHGCERYASHNDNVGGCKDNLSDYLTGEAIFGEDLVVWYSMTFHHLPTDEDESNMHSHWDGFEIVPRDWSASNPLPEAPEITPLAAVNLTEGIPASVDLVTANPAAATLTYEVDGLPAGLAIDPGTGQISGTPAAGSAGDYTAKVRVLGTLAGKPEWMGDSVALTMSVAAELPCVDGLDNDGDGLIDHPADPGCSDVGDLSENAPGMDCDDGLDNDDDGLVDVADPGCPYPGSKIEDPACDDGIDNDRDGKVDADDPQCTPTEVKTEHKLCGLGWEFAVIAPILASVARRRRSAMRSREASTPADSGTR